MLVVYLHCFNQEAFTGGSVALKRKASQPSPTAADECSKKPHSNPCFDFSDSMELADCDEVDSDATMTASESEDNPLKAEVLSDDPSRRMTYAEIVKCGMKTTSLEECKGTNKAVLVQNFVSCSKFLNK